MELFLSILVYVAVLFLTDPSTALPHNPPHNYLGRPRDKRCPAVSEGQLLCPQHARSCSLAKLDGCDHDGQCQLTYYLFWHTFKHLDNDRDKRLNVCELNI